MIWTVGLPLRSRLPHLPGVPHLHVNKPTKGYTTLFAIFFIVSNVSSHQLNSETYGPVLPLKTIYKITEIGRVIWLVKNLWFIIPVNPYKKASGPRAINKTGYWCANNDFRKAEKTEQVTYPVLFNIMIKSVGFHSLLLSVTIRYCHSFRSYKVQSW